MLANSRLFMHFPVYCKLYQPSTAYSSLFQYIQANSSLLQPFRGHINWELNSVHIFLFTRITKKSIFNKFTYNLWGNQFLFSKYPDGNRVTISFYWLTIRKLSQNLLGSTNYNLPLQTNQQHNFRLLDRSGHTIWLTLKYFPHTISLSC